MKQPGRIRSAGWAARTCCAWGLLALLAGPGFAEPPLQRATLTRENAEQLAPRGDESDWIYGDIVLRNDHLVAVVARPVAGRNANWVLREVGCSVIDFTHSQRPEEALGIFRPGGPGIVYRAAATQPIDFALGEAGGDFRCVSEQRGAQPEIQLRYRLLTDSLEIETLHINRSNAPLEFELEDELRAEETFEKPGDGSGKGSASLFWAYDRHAGQAFGVTRLGGPLRFVSDWRNTRLFYPQRPAGPIRLGPGESHRLVRRLFVAADLLGLRAKVDRAGGTPLHAASLSVSDPEGPVADAEITLLDSQGRRLAVGRANQEGRRRIELPAGSYALSITAPGRNVREVALEIPETSQLSVLLDAPGRLEATLIDGIGDRIPAKLQFVGVGETKSPNFGPAQGDHALRNVYNTHDGRVERELAPGSYRLIASRGPEYDAAQQIVEVKAGATTRIELRLRRSVDTRGWVSADLHTHSTESGDTTSSQRGRVLNLLAEHIEFAPATEHNRISDYRPHLEALGVEGLMSTSSGVEMTGDFPMNHQNAFPLLFHPRTQDGGAPLAAGPELQVRRLREHDAASEKLVQQNHPDFFQILYDRDRDGASDGGYAGLLGDVDVFEIYPLAAFLNEEHSEERGSRMLLWLQLLNRGVRIPAVVNTDAHSNFHGAGPRRTYIRSATDYPRAIDPLEIARELKKGHAIMTSGPFLEVAMQVAGVENPIALPGDDLSAPGGAAELTIRVQCPNWFDIDRVQVLLNGRFVPELNFTRASTPQRFSRAPVRFVALLPMELDRDAHVVVVAAGQGSKLGMPMGQRNAGIMPIAVSNPIFVDVDGDGFQPNYDRLGVALPSGADWPDAGAADAAPSAQGEKAASPGSGS